MTTQKWREVWEETRTAMKHLEESMELVRGLERSALVGQHADICSEGVTKALDRMRDSVQQVRARVHAADIQLTTAVETVIADSALEELAKIRSVNGKH